ncbi:hypothetical protein JW979_12215, partial [bacterium]|nr:hypothetical protein [candidate division CSSED10-310 bacterium]
MKHVGIIFLLLSILVPGVMARIGEELPLKNLEPGIHYVPGELLIKFVSHLSQQEKRDILEKYQMAFLQEKPTLGWELVSIPEESEFAVPKMISVLQEDPRIEGITPNYYRFLEWEPNDWYWTEDHLWNFRILRMPEAWDMDIEAPLYGGDPDVVIAVIDSGCIYKTWTDTEHYTDENGNPVDVDFAQAPDFENLNFWVNTDEIAGNGIDDDGNDYIDDTEGWNFVFDSPFPSDDKGHGSHVTGTIAQSTNNDDGGGVETLKSAAGMAFECTVMIL